MSEHTLISLASIIILGVGAQWLAWRIKIPSILFLLVFGFIAGPITGFLNSDQLMGDLLLPFVSLSVAVILFEGGLTLDIKELREIGGTMFSLVSIGMVVSWGISTATAYYLLGLSFQISILLGAVLVVTGPTVVGPLLKHIRPSGKVRDILKWEGIVIDPIGALLALLVFEAVLAGSNREASTLVLISIGKTLLFGGLSGFIFAQILVFLIRKFWMPDYLHVAVTLMLVLASYVVSNYFQHESGLFATTLMGIVLANQHKVSVQHILVFKENLSVLIISTLFIILSARLDLATFSTISSLSVVFLLILIFVGRPLSVFASTVGSKLNLKEKLFLSWMAPRGIVAAAVSSIFALQLSQANIEGAEFLVPLTFVVIVGTVAVYGLSSSVVAKWLGVSKANPQGLLIAGAAPWVRAMAKTLKDNGIEVMMVDTNRTDVKQAKMAEMSTIHGSILSETIIDDINLAGIGRFLALTPNDEVNSLAAIHLREVFGSEDLYQLHPVEQALAQTDSETPKHLRGRYLFDEQATFYFFTRKLNEGFEFKATHLTSEFTFQHFQDHYPGEVLPLFIISEGKELSVFANDSKTVPNDGDTIVALVKDGE